MNSFQMKFAINFPVLHILYKDFKHSNRFDALLSEKDMKINERNQIKSLVEKPSTHHG